MSEGQRVPDTISVALQERAFPKRDVEDAVPYIFQRAYNIRPYIGTPRAASPTQKKAIRSKASYGFFYRFSCFFTRLDITAASTSLIMSNGTKGITQSFSAL